MQKINQARNIYLEGANRIVSSYSNHFSFDGTSPAISLKFASAQGETYFLRQSGFALSGDTAFIVNQNTPLRTKVRCTEPVRGICFYFDAGLIARAMRNLTCTQRELLENQHLNTDFEIVEGLFSLKRFAIKTPALLPFGNTEKDELQDFFYAWVADFARLQISLNKLCVKTDIGSKSSAMEIIRRLETAVEYLESNTMKAVSLEELSSVATLSKFYLLSQFKKVYGASPYQFHLKLRLHRSKNLIATNQHSLTEIAYLIGFADLPSFSKAFKKQFGTSPSAFSEIA